MFRLLISLNFKEFIIIGVNYFLQIFSLNFMLCYDVSIKALQINVYIFLFHYNSRENLEYSLYENKHPEE